MLYFKALILGFIVSMPVGPIAILILQRSVRTNHLSGIASGIGAALADGIFALLACLGMLALTAWIQDSIVWIRPTGGVILAVLGLYFFFQKTPPLQAKEVLKKEHKHQYIWDAFSAFLLTLTNPLTIIAMGALFTGSDLIPVDPDKIDFFEISTGVLCGSFLWWGTIAVLSDQIKSMISPMKIHRLMQALAIVLIVLGGLAVASILTSLRA
jgi:threonine/homoserine/homoserine lactone efflux protein